MINKQAIRHIPNSKMAYALNDNTLFISLEAAKGDFQKVELIIGDPHDYVPDENLVYHWVIKDYPHIVMEKKYSTELYDYFISTPILKYNRAKYSFILYEKNNNKMYYYGSKGIREISTIDDSVYDNFQYFCFPYINKEDIINPIPWISKTIWYQIFPERFSKHETNKKDKYLPWGSVTDKLTNQMFFGGNLLGIIDKIPYLKSLGINGIYFNPIFKSPSTHKYDTTDYFLIDPQFGTNEDFALLVKECHNNGIKVMLDAVFNHCGWSHPFFQDVIKYGKKSKYYDCFFIDSDDFIDFPLKNGLPNYQGRIIPKFKTFAFTPFMPKLNTSNPIMEKYLLDVTRFWIEKYDIDGWRLDVSNEVSHAFWRKFRNVCNESKKDFYILGENWEDSNPWLGNDQLNAVMNYELSYPIWMFFGKKQYNDDEFIYKINEIILKYPRNVSQNMFNLIGSHDTERILHLCNENISLVMLSFIFLFSFSGSPSVYYGDEIGLTGGNDPDNRRCMIWDEKKQNNSLLTFFKKLINLRKNNNALSSVDIDWIYNANNVIIYRKKSLNQTLYVIMNNNDHNKEIQLTEQLVNKPFMEIYQNKRIGFETRLVLLPYEFYILEEINFKKK